MRRRPLVVCVSAPDTDLDKVRDRFVGILLDSSSPHSSSNTSARARSIEREPHNEVSARLSRYCGKVRAGVAAGFALDQRSLKFFTKAAAR